MWYNEFNLEELQQNQSRATLRRYRRCQWLLSLLKMGMFVLGLLILVFVTRWTIYATLAQHSKCIANRVQDIRLPVVVRSPNISSAEWQNILNDTIDTL